MISAVSHRGQGRSLTPGLEVDSGSHLLLLIWYAFDAPVSRGPALLLSRSYRADETARPMAPVKGPPRQAWLHYTATEALVAWKSSGPIGVSVAAGV